MTGSPVAVGVDPRREAFERAGGRFETRVLEPSPPPADEPPWFADDPVAPEPRTTALPLVSPVRGGDVTWDELADGEPDLAGWCADRWLGAWRPLPPLPDRDALVATRVALHALAEHVLAPARRRANGKIGLRYTFDGFGAPFFGVGGTAEQVRVEGTDVVVVHDGGLLREPVTTIAAAARFVGVDPHPPADLYTPTTAFAPDAPLEVDAGAARVVADWFGFACSVLEELRAAEHAGDTRTQIWPEHFDLAVELGEDPDHRGTFGASPGDAAHAEPYLYVTHWSDVPDHPFWNDPHFAGASLPYAALAAAPDQRAGALAFFREGFAVLRARGT